MDYSDIKTLKQTIEIIKNLKKLVQEQYSYIEELEDNSNSVIVELQDIQDNVYILEEEINELKEVFDIIGLSANRILKMSVYDAMRLDDFMKGF